MDASPYPAHKRAKTNVYTARSHAIEIVVREMECTQLAKFRLVHAR